jgi:predicted short-subunit dehydrogenase-like oxidoreductase (DUF2520 family)
MARKPTVTIVGPGNLGSSLALALHAAGYKIEELVTRDQPESLRHAAAVARRVKSRAVVLADAELRSDVLWLCVPDDAVASAARALARRWQGKFALHSSGALPSALLKPLRKSGVAIASVHPMMTFVRSRADAGVFRGVSFAVEGDRAVVRAARSIARDLGARTVFTIEARNKPLYHAWGSFSSPLTIATITMGEQVALAAGVPEAELRQVIEPIIRRTIENYLAAGAERAFSGPIVRGDLQTVAKHLRELRRVPHARDVYVTLARAALRYLPVKKKAELERLLNR